VTKEFFLWPIINRLPTSISPRTDCSYNEDLYHEPMLISSNSMDNKNGQRNNDLDEFELVEEFTKISIDEKPI